MKDVSEEEEESTAGVTSLTNTSAPVTVTPTEDEVESRKLGAIPEAEEALVEVGAEIGKTMVCAVCHGCVVTASPFFQVK